MAVLRGQRAGIALLRAFFNAPLGDVLFEVAYGVEAAEPDQILVFLELGALRAVFTPAELSVLGRMMIEQLPQMRALGAPEMAVDDLRRFADLLLKSSREAGGVSPRGLN